MTRILAVVVVVVVLVLSGAWVAGQMRRKTCQPFPVDDRDIQALKAGRYPVINLAHGEVVDRVVVNVKEGSVGQFVFHCQ